MKKKVIGSMLCFVFIIAVVFGVLYVVDHHRMKNNEPVVFSTWGYDYAPPEENPDETITINEYDEAYNPDEEQSFVGTVIEETTSYMIVEPAEDEYERTVADRIKIEYGTDHIDYLYGTGRMVVIYYKGGINTDGGKMSSIKSDDISTEGFRDFSLHVVRTEGAVEVGAEIHYGPPKAVLSSNDTQGFTSFGHLSDENLYYYGLNNVYISVDDKDLPLKEALEKGKITLDGIIAKCNQDVADGVIEELVYKDGGSQVYEYPEYTIIKYHTLDGNRDVYIGVPGMDINVKDK